MLAALGDYLFWWQLPVIILLLLSWLVGSGFVLQWAVRRQTGERQVAYGRCAMVSFLAGLGGAFAGGVMYMCIQAVGAAIYASLTAPGALLAGAAFALVSFLVVYAFFDMSARRTLFAWACAAGTMAALALVLGLPTAMISYDRRQDNLARLLCQQNLLRIHRGILQRHGFMDAPPRLQDLLTGDALKPSELRCPASREGYCYVPSASLPTERDSLEIRAADPRPSHQGSRNVVFVNGRLAEYDEQQFQELLKLPENAEFAQALRRLQQR